MSTGGRLTDWVAVECRECVGTGETPATAAEIAELDAMVAATVVEIETEMGVASAAPITTSMPMPVHPNMSPEWFDNAVRRAFNAELSISRTSRASVVAVSSATDCDISYLVTRETCQCSGHRSVGRCYHRALACWYWWVLDCDAVAENAHRQAHPVTDRELIAA